MGNQVSFETKVCGEELKLLGQLIVDGCVDEGQRFGWEKAHTSRARRRDSFTIRVAR